MPTTTRIRWRALKRGDKRPAGYQYRYKDATGWTPWLAGDDELVGCKIAGTAQFRAPVKR